MKDTSILKGTQPDVLAALYLADPELSCAHISYDLIDFAAGRNTVCRSSRSSSLHRSRSDSSFSTTRAPIPLPPPRPFRRSGASNRRTSSHRNDELLLSLPTTLRSGSSGRWPVQEFTPEDFEDDLLMFLFTAEAVN